MVYLAVAIILTSYLTLSFKVLEKLRIANFPGIVFNYIACVFTGWLSTGTPPFSGGLSAPWLPWAALMGVLFVILLNMIGFSAQRINVAVTSVATKLSLVITFLASLVLYGEHVGPWQVLGIVLAMVAVWLTCWPQGGIHGRSGKEHQGWMILVPLALFLGSGLLDSLIKYVQQRFMAGAGADSVISTAFAVAGSLGFLLLMYRLVTGKERFDPRTIIAGVAIGVPNYLSMWFLMKVLSHYPGRSAMIFPVVNMSIVLFSAVMARLLFNEHISAMNRWGIALSLAAIALIAWG
jgi:drug/metabolite transporter (DMT)-like permease